MTRDQLDEMMTSLTEIVDAFVAEHKLKRSRLHLRLDVVGATWSAGHASTVYVGYGDTPQTALADLAEAL